MYALPKSFGFDSSYINSATGFFHNELINYIHPMWGKSDHIDLDAVVLNFLSHASGQDYKKDSTGQTPNIFASMINKEELPRMIEQLRKDCTPEQVERIGDLIRMTITENQKQRVTKLKGYTRDYIFDKWSKNDQWAVAMKTLCEQFEIPLPPEYEKEWE
ncbi:MAG: hypothetical protein ABH887_00255 [bacterium]